MEKKFDNGEEHSEINNPSLESSGPLQAAPPKF